MLSKIQLSYTYQSKALGIVIEDTKKSIEDGLHHLADHAKNTAIDLLHIVVTKNFFQFDTSLETRVKNSLVRPPIRI